MLTLITSNLWVFIVALVIGLATAWWVWGRAPSVDADWDNDGKTGEIGDAVSGGLGKIGAGITGAVGGVAAAGAAGLGKVGDIAGDVVEATVDGAEAVGGAVAATAGSAVDLAKDAGSAVVDGVSATGAAAAGGAAAVGGAVAGAASTGKDKAVGLMSDVGSAIPKPKIKAAVGAPDNLELLKGVGPKLNALLISLGVTRFDQIAEWTAGDIAEVDQHLGNFKGPVERDNWIDQAKLLAAGDTAGFEAKYGSLGSEINKG